MKFKALATVGILLAAALVPLGVTSASATTGYEGEVCTPSAAWTETIDHPAVGEPTLTVPNPGYVPGIPAVTKDVVHPAVTEQVKHEAETHTEYHFAKFTRERTRTFSIYGWSAWTDYGAWSKYSPETHTSWELSTAPLGQPAYHSSGGRNWGTVQWERQWQAQYDGQTRTIVDKAEWWETVVVTPERTETVEVTPAVPAVGEPTKQVPNPDYVEARTENVEHPAVTCPAPPAHNANGKATCGAWDITLYNVQAEGYKNQTASYVVYIDGKFNAAYAVAANKTEAISGTFPEDSGNHQVIVRSGPAQGDKIVFSLDVTSDCIAPQPKDDVVIGEWSKPVITCDSKVGDVVTITREVSTTEYVLSENGWVPGKAVITAEEDTYTVTADDIKALKCAVVVPPVEKPTAKPVKAAAVSDSTLAQTGGVVSPWLVGGGIAALLAAAGIRIASRQR